MVKRIIVSILLVFILYLFFYPVAIDPVKWMPPENQGFTGIYQANNKLSVMELLFPDHCEGCEDVAIDNAGTIYGASVTGDIVKLNLGNQNAETIINTGGRPLGLDLDPAGDLVIADAIKGLLKLQLETNELVTLSTEHGGLPYKFTDDLETDSTGNIYFSDASSKFGIHKYKYDLFEHRPYGRLLRYNLNTKKTDLLLDQLYFANGIALAHDEEFVLVNETGLYRVMKYWLKGPKSGITEVFIENLPGFPDGISKGEEGIFWLTLISPRKKALDGIMDKPFLRKILVRLPDFLQPKPENYNCILGLDVNGKVVYNLQSNKPVLSQIASVQQKGSHLYFGSLAYKGVGRYKLVD